MSLAKRMWKVHVLVMVLEDAHGPCDSKLADFRDSMAMLILQASPEGWKVLVIGLSI